jgi:hypothetical protein
MLFISASLVAQFETLANHDNIQRNITLNQFLQIKLQGEGSKRGEKVLFSKCTRAFVLERIPIFEKDVQKKDS